ncbi:uncharacterized protein METZ01_LOCUS148851 [marine metagenome]|uniref:Uncharacterized protein n=1 Tax=marine metagenome TaxID=408172 RepID=A0A382A4I4_9ZZZZ
MKLMLIAFLQAYSVLPAINRNFLDHKKWNRNIAHN